MNRREFFQTSAAGVLAGKVIPADAIIRKMNRSADDLAERMAKTVTMQMTWFEYNDDAFDALDQILERESHRAGLTEMLYGLNPR